MCQDVSSMSLELRLDKAESDLTLQKVTIDNLREDNDYLKIKVEKLATLFEGLLV